MSIVCTLEPKVNLFKNSAAKNMLVLKNNNALKHTGSINGAVVDPAKNYNNNIYAKDKSTLKQMMCEANIFYAKHLFMKSIYV